MLLTIFNSILIIFLIAVLLLPFSMVAAFKMWQKNKDANSVWLKRLYYYRTTVSSLVIFLYLNFYVSKISSPILMVLAIIFSLVALWLLLRKWTGNGIKEELLMNKELIYVVTSFSIILIIFYIFWKYFIVTST